jgi:hypothetical protein
MAPKIAANYRQFIKWKIPTTLAALSLLFAVVSTQGSYLGRGHGRYYGHEYGYPTYRYPTYGYGPSIVGPAYLGNPWGYGYGTDGLDEWSGYDLQPPAPNPIGPPKTIEIPPERGR